MDQSLATHLGRIVVAVTLFSAGLMKIPRAQRFRSSLVGARLLATPSIPIVVVLVPALEILLPIWLLASLDSTRAAAATLALLVSFTIYVVALRVLKREPACGCFGGTKATGNAVVRNAGFISLMLAGLIPSLAGYLSALGAAFLVAFVGMVMERAHAARRLAVAQRG